jgi:hypothetical protein
MIDPELAGNGEKHSPATVNYPERIARAQREIDAIEAEIRAGTPDVQGLCRGLVDWSCELRRLEKERAGQSDLACNSGGRERRCDPAMTV